MDDEIPAPFGAEARRALAETEATGIPPAVADAERLEERERLSGEAAFLAGDPEDRREARAVTEVMEELRAPW